MDKFITYRPIKCEICERYRKATLVDPLPAATQKILDIKAMGRAFDVQRSDAWQEKRAKLVTASRLAVYLGRNFFQPAQVKAFHDAFALEFPEHHTNERVESEAMRWGTDHEDDAITAYEAKTGHCVIREAPLVEVPGFEDKFAASPDGITACGRLLEIKCPFSRISAGAKCVPVIYAPQVALQLLAVEAKYLDFVTFRPEGYGDRGQVVPGRPQVLNIIKVDRLSAVDQLFRDFSKRHPELYQELKDVLANEGVREMLRLWLHRVVIPSVRNFEDAVELERTLVADEFQGASLADPCPCPCIE